MANPDQEIARGHAAQRLLDDPLYQEAWNALVERATSALLSGEVEPDLLVRLRRDRDSLMALRGEFERLVRNGKLAQKVKDGNAAKQ